MSQAAVAFDRALSTILESVQAGVAVVASCLPILPPVLKKVVCGSMEWSIPRSDPRGASPSGPVVWMQTIGGREIALTGSKAPLDYLSPKQMRPDGNAGGESTGRDSLELGHISCI